MSEPARPSGAGRDLPAIVERLTSARFGVAFRGYEPREVHDLLAEVSAALHALVEKGGPPVEQAATHGGLERAEATASSIIRAAKEGSERRIAAARNEADLIVASAKARAEGVVRDALAEADRILEAAVSDADALRREAGEFRDKARAAVLESIREANMLLARGEDESRRFSRVGIVQPVPDPLVAAAPGDEGVDPEPGSSAEAAPNDVKVEGAESEGQGDVPATDPSPWPVGDRDSGGGD